MTEPRGGLSGRRGDRHGRRHPLDLRRLEQFVAIVDCGSLTDAALELGVTQQALSAAIRTLEAELDVMLFVRSRGMRPSEAGRRLYQAAQILLADAGRTVKEVQAAARGPAAPLKIGYTPGLRSYQVYDVFADRVADEVALNLECSSPTQLRERLNSGDLDLGLCGGSWPDAGFNRRVLGRLPVNVALRVEDSLELSDVDLGLAGLARLSLLRCGPESEAVELASLLTQCRELGVDPHVQDVCCLGLDPAATPLAAERAYAFVTDEPGVYFCGRIVVRSMREPLSLPVQAVWLNSMTPESIGKVAAALPTETGHWSVPTTQP